jgi:glycosyltransferase involved in cell wall biosynthesis
LKRRLIEMHTPPDIALVIPARDEELSLPGVLSRVPHEITRIVVVDNGSRDGTAQVAARYGAQVVHEPVPGYGRACLAGLAALESAPPQLVAFVDADGSDALSCLTDLMAPVLAGEQDLVLGWRIPAQRAALSFQQRFGHVLATTLIRLFWGHRFKDLGPMRVISWAALKRLQMADQAFGWTVEMQVRAIKAGLRIQELRVPYYPRSAGTSKISRTVSGTVKAGSTILLVIARELVAGMPRRGAAPAASVELPALPPTTNRSELPCRH